MQCNECGSADVAYSHRNAECSVWECMDCANTFQVLIPRPEVRHPKKNAAPIEQMAKAAGFLDRTAFAHNEQLKAFARVIAEDLATVLEDRAVHHNGPHVVTLEMNQMARAFRDRYSAL